MASLKEVSCLRAMQAFTPSPIKTQMNNETTVIEFGSRRLCWINKASITQIFVLTIRHIPLDLIQYLFIRW